MNGFNNNGKNQNQNNENIYKQENQQMNNNPNLNQGMNNQKNNNDLNLKQSESDFVVRASIYHDFNASPNFQVEENKSNVYTISGGLFEGSNQMRRNYTNFYNKNPNQNFYNNNYQNRNFGRIF